VNYSYKGGLMESTKGRDNIAGGQPKSSNRTGYQKTDTGKCKSGDNNFFDTRKQSSHKRRTS